MRDSDQSRTPPPTSEIDTTDTIYFITESGGELPLARMAPDQVALAERILAQVARDPWSLSQSTWAHRTPDRGTTRCIAGWALTLAQLDTLFRYEPIDEEFGGGWEAATCLLDGRLVPTVAADLLGLTVGQSEWLFQSAGELEAVEYLRLSVVAARPPSTPDRSV